MEKLALLGGDPLKTKPFPEWPQYDEHEQEALLEVLESGAWWRTPGSRTKAFEEAFAAYHDARYGIACTNGTAAIEIMISALGLDWAMKSSYLISPLWRPPQPSCCTVRYLFSWMSIGIPTASTRKSESRDNGADQGDYCSAPGGHPADLDALQEIADQYGLHLLEDCAHAHGSEWKGKKSVPSEKLAHSVFNRAN